MLRLQAIRARISVVQHKVLGNRGGCAPKQFVLRYLSSNIRYSVTKGFLGYQ